MDLLLEYMTTHNLVTPFDESLHSIEELISEMRTNLMGLQSLAMDDDEEFPLLLRQFQPDDDKFNVTTDQLNYLKKIKSDYKRLHEHEPLPVTKFAPLPYFDNDFILSRATKSIKPFGSDTRSRKATQAQRILRKLSSPTNYEAMHPPPSDQDEEEMDQFETMPQIEDALDLKMAMTSEQMQFLKAITLEDRRARKGKLASAAERITVPHTGLMVHCSCPLSALDKKLINQIPTPRKFDSAPHSPPIFCRPPTTPVVPSFIEQRETYCLLEDALKGKNPGYPVTSPLSDRFTIDAWNNLEKIQPAPSSSSTEKIDRVERPIWSSPKHLSSPFTEEPLLSAMEIEEPVFTRTQIKTEIQCHPIATSDYPDQEIDELDSDLDELEDDDLIPGLRKDLALLSRPEVLIPETIHNMLDEIDRVSAEVPTNALLIDARLQISDLSVTPPIEPLSLASFSTTSKSSPWSLQILSGLRSLTLELNWQAWKLSEVETVFQICAQGMEAEEEELMHDAKQLQNRFEDKVMHGYVQQSIIQTELSFEDCFTYDDADDAELIPRLVNLLPALMTESIIEADTTFNRPSCDHKIALASPQFSPLEFTQTQQHRDIRSSSIEFISPPASVNLSPCHSFIEPVRVEDDVTGNSTVVTQDGRSLGAAEEGAEEEKGGDCGATLTLAQSPIADSLVAADPLEDLIKKRSAQKEPNGNRLGRLSSYLVTRGRSSLNIAHTPIARLSPKPDIVIDNGDMPSSRRARPELPFSIPSFVSRLSTGGQGSDLIRIVSSPALNQMPRLYQSLLDQSIHLIDRPSLREESREPFKITHPHLIVDGRTSIIFIPLSKVLGNAYCSADTQLTQSVKKLKRQETIFSSLRRLNLSYERVILILEEREITPASGVNPYDYTPPVLNSLRQLDQEVERANLGVEVAFSTSVAESGQLVRCLMEELRALELRRVVGGLRVWNDRDWITDDPTQNELHLLQIPQLNPLSACFILSWMDIPAFLQLSREARNETFRDGISSDKLDGISDHLKILSIARAQQQLKGTPNRAIQYRLHSPRAPSEYLSLSALGLDEYSTEL